MIGASSRMPCCRRLLPSVPRMFRLMTRRPTRTSTGDRQYQRSLGWLARRTAAAWCVWSGAVAVVTRPAAAQTINFRQYTGADGLPQAQVMGMRQDRQGYMWFGTYGGLSRFDGGAFHTYTKDNGLSSNAVFDIVEDPAGRLLLATSGGLCIKQGEHFRCHRQAEGLVSDNARSIALDAKGGIWIGTLRGLSHFRDGAFKSYTTEQGLPAERVIRVVVGSRGRAWAATPRGLVRRQGERFAPDARRLPGDTLVHFIAPADGGLLIGVEGHLYLRRGDVITPVAVGAIPPGTAFVDGAIDREGTIWVATRTGVLRIANDRVDHI